jgi:hypothetical protein
MKGLLATLQSLDALVSDRLAQGVLFEQLAEIPFRSGLFKLRGIADPEFSSSAKDWLAEIEESLRSIEVVVR